MKYFVIAGEPSGDQHAAHLIESLARIDAEAEFGVVGGDQMAKLAGQPIIHTDQMAFMGFTQLIAHMGQIRRNFKLTKEGVTRFAPDVLVLVDYPGFNLRIARWAYRCDIPVYYYIPPKGWAWNTKRVLKLKQYTQRIFSILPFETDFFARFDVSAEYVGNPVYELIHRFNKKAVMTIPEERKIALLPGSRKQEIERILPEMIKMLAHFPDHQFVVAGMETHQNLYERLISDLDRVALDYSGTLSVLNGAEAALVTSGTATLETALMGVPQVVCYKTNQLSYQIAKRLIKVPYISLVNLILAGPAVPELIQNNCRSDLLKSCLDQILPDGPNRQAQLEICDQLKEKLGRQDVSNYLAELIIKYLTATKANAKFS